MSDFSKEYGNTVIVPVSVEAMSLRPGDVGKVELAGPYADFSKLTTAEYRANRIGSLETRTASGADVGVHLQWMLPPPFTSGVARDSRTDKSSTDDQRDKVSFRPAPNRWLVTRFVKMKDLLQVKGAQPESWVIESDFCTYEPQWDGTSVPMEPRGRQAAAYVGRCCRLRDWNPRGAVQGTERQLGWKLTAIGWGDPAFASYYPSCRNVFGFHDTLEDGDGNPIPGIDEVSYVVLGWHSQPEDDILSERSRANPLFSMPPWGLTDGGDMNSMRRSLYRGYAAFLRMDERGCSEATLTAGTTQVVLGNSAQETVAALAATGKDTTDDAGRFAVERMINGRLAGLDQSMPVLDNDATHVDDDLHMLRFLAVEGGKNWSVRRKPLEQRSSETAEEAKLAKIAEEANTPIPAGILSSLAACNAAQREFDYSLRRWIAHRRCIRDDLSLLEMMTWDPKSLPVEAGAWSDIRVNLRRRFERDMEMIYRIDLPRLEARFVEAMRRLQLVVEALSSAEASYEIHEVPGPRFWQPRDPVVLLKSPEIRASSRYGQGFRRALATLGDLKKVSPASLPCTPAAAVPLPTAGSVHPEVAFEKTPHSEAIWRILAEAWAQIGYDAAREMIRKVEGGIDTAAVNRERLLKAHPNQSGRPVFFRWTARYLPTLPESTTTGRYKEDAVDRHWKFASSVREHAELHPAGGNGWSNRPVELTGVSLAEGRVAKDLVDRLADRMPEAKPLAGGHYVSCTLSGFHDHLMMYCPAFNLPFRERARLLHLLEIPAWLASEQRGDSLQPDPACPESPARDSSRQPEFSPLRGGGLQLVKLEMIDTFGRVRNIPLDRGVVSLAASVTPESSMCEGALVALLPPRLCMPARLAFRLKPAVAGKTDVSSLAGSASPVCGWIIPSHVEKGLFLAGPDGDIKGILRERGTEAPVFLPVPGRKDSALHPQLESLKAALLAGNLSLFDLRRNLEAEILKIVPEQRQGEAALCHLMGRPLAVVSAEMGIDLQGDLAPRRQTLSTVDHAEDEPDLLKVRVPVMLGAATRSNDGLAAFFLAEPDEGFDFTKLWLPGDQSPHPTLRIADHGRDRRLRLLLIMDPQAPVHATTGLFPVKPISLPPAHFEAAREKMSVLFTAGPLLLADQEDWTLPLPPVEHQTWHWAENATASGDPWAAVVEAAQLPAQTDAPRAGILKNRLWFSLRATSKKPPSSDKETRPS